MKFRWDKKYLYWGVTAFIVIAASITLYMTLSKFDAVVSGLKTFADVMMPITLGIILAYLLTPMMNFFDAKILNGLNKKAKVKNTKHKKNLAKSLAIFIALIIFFAFIAGFFLLAVPQITDSVTSIVDNMPTYFTNINEMVLDLLAENAELEAMVSDLLNTFSETIFDVVRTQLLPQMNNLIANLTSGVIEVFGFLLNFLIGIVVSVYILYSKDLFCAQAKKILYAFVPIKSANSFISTVRRAHKIFGGFIVGKLLDSLIIGMICFIVMTIFNWPYAMLISVIIGVTNIIPFFGPFIGAVPSIILIIMVEPIVGLYFAIFVLILQQFDGNILGPKILGDSTGLSSFWVIFSLLVFGGFFGFVGMAVGVPTFAVIYTLITDYIYRSLKKKKMPVDTSEFEDMECMEEETKVIVKNSTVKEK